MKKFISILIIMIMLIPVLPVSADDGTEMTDGNFRYTVLYNSLACITGYVNEPEGDLIIPEKIGGYNQIQINKQAFKNCSKITALVAENVYNIEQEAFSGCSAMESAYLPKATIMRYYAFLNCSSLASVYMPRIVQLDNPVFKGCTSLTEYVCSDKYTVEGSMLFDKDVTTVLEACGTQGDVAFPSTVTKIGSNAFYKAAINRVNAQNITYLCEDAFTQSTIKSINMPNVETIMDRAFYNCQNLEDTGSINAKYIGEFSFNMCDSLKVVHITQAEELGAGAFNNCFNMERAYFYCDAPKADIENIPFTEDDGFVIYYLEGKAGWTSPRWYRSLAMPFNPEISHTVTFKDMDDTTLKTEEVYDGVGATAPQVPEHDGFVFIGWDKDFSAVHEDMTVTALYNSVSDDYLLGDVNRDGVVNTGDATFVLRYCADIIQFDEDQLRRANYNNDNTVNTADATAILRYCATN